MKSWAGIDLYMHELSLAQSLLGSANDIGRKQGVVRITKIYITIGQFGMVMEDQFTFCLDIMKSEFDLTKDVEFDISWEAGVIACGECGYNGMAEDSDEEKLGLISVFRCPDCNSYDTEIVSGTDTFIEKMDVEMKENKD